ncbi:MAG: tyrosine-type recombinase/integrase [Bilophila wadsworthia]
MPIRDDVLGLLRRWHEEDRQTGCAYVIAYKGRPVRSISSGWHNALRQAGIARRIRPYDLRHAFASLALVYGADIKCVAETMGHKNITMLLSVYQHTLSNSAGGPSTPRRGSFRARARNGARKNASRPAGGRRPARSSNRPRNAGRRLRTTRRPHGALPLAFALEPARRTGRMPGLRTHGSRTEAGRDERGFPAGWPFWRVAPLA